MELNLIVEYVNPRNDIDDIKEALFNIACCDADFVGDNGDEYLWDVSKDNNYDSNCQYLLDTIKTDSNELFIENFIIEWIEMDDFYDDYEYEITYNEWGKIIAISLAYTTRY